MVTIKDVAQKAGVNPSTVSRVIKDNAAISQKTKQKVRKAMQDLGYVPNVAAQMLASGLTQCIAVVFPPLINMERISEPFFMEILTTINDEAKEKSFTVSIATGDSLDDLVSQVRIMYQQKRVDGFIVLYSEKKDPVRRFLSNNNIPFVVVGALEDGKNKVSCIDNDNRLMGRMAVDYFSDMGHDGIIFVTNDQNSEVFRERYAGYQEGMTRLGYISQESLLFDHRDPLILEAFIGKVRKQKPTALLVIGDVLSIKIIQFLSYYGLKVPDDISIISFNNSAYAKIVHPYLTTFDINVNRLGRASLKQLLSRIASGTDEIERTLVPFTLKERESVRNIK